MIILGLTGSIGMGKSTTAQMFRQEGISVYDADAAVHELYRNEAVEPVGKIFPAAIVDGVVDRKKLGKIVLGNADDLKRLENLVHPLVHRKEQEFLKKARENDALLVVLDIPLLFETHGENRVDAIVVVTADEIIQRERVLSRHDMNEEKFLIILAKQLPDAQKRKRADFVIDTGLGMDHAHDCVLNIIAHYKSD